MAEHELFDADDAVAPPRQMEKRRTAHRPEADDGDIVNARMDHRLRS